jgi:hypothetical protein
MHGRLFSDTVLDWIRKGILKLRVVPDMIYGGSVDVGTVPVEKSVVWRTFAEGTDGCSFIPAIRLIDYNSLNLRHPTPNTLHSTTINWRYGFGRNLPRFSELSGKKILSYDSRTTPLNSTRHSWVTKDSIDDLYKCLLYISLVKFCYEHPLLIEEVVAVEKPVHLLSTKALRQSEERKCLRCKAQRLLQSRFDRRMESAEDAVSKKRLESERVRMDVQNQNDSSLPIKHHWG